MAERFDADGVGRTDPSPGASAVGDVPAHLRTGQGAGVYVPKAVIALDTGILIPAGDPRAAFRLAPGDNGGVTRFTVRPDATPTVVLFPDARPQDVLVDGEPVIPGQAYPVSQGMTIRALRPVIVHLRPESGVSVGGPAG